MHLDVKYHLIHDVLASKQLELIKIYTTEDGSDMMTNPLFGSEGEGGSEGE